MPWSAKLNLALFPILLRGEAHQSHLIELSPDSSCLVGCYTVNIRRVTFQVSAEEYLATFTLGIDHDCNQSSKQYNFHSKCFVILQQSTGWCRLNANPHLNCAFRGKQNIPM